MPVAQRSVVFCRRRLGDQPHDLARADGEREIAHRGEFAVTLGQPVTSIMADCGESRPGVKRRLADTAGVPSRGKINLHARLDKSETFQAVCVVTPVTQQNQL